MCILKKKSDENFSALDLLINSDLNTPVIHCAYYGCFQLIMKFVYDYVKITDEELKEGLNSTGSHNFFLGTLTKEIKAHDVKCAIDFYKFFSTFKRKRTEADYQNIEITRNDSLISKEKAEKIKQFLNYLDNGEFKNIHKI